MITWEPYIAAFTGTLTTFTTTTGVKYTIPKDRPRLTKGQALMLAIDTETGQIRFVPVVMPPYWEGLRR